MGAVGNVRKRGGPGTSDPGRIIWNSQTLPGLLAAAWEVDEERIVVPSRQKRQGDWYEVTATMPPDTRRDAFQLMLQNLLIERFSIKLHHETRVYPGYTLVIAKGGPKLKQAADPNAPPTVWGRDLEYGPDGFPVIPPGHGTMAAMRRGGVFMTYQGFSMAEFTRSSRFAYCLEQVSGHPWDYIEDETGLKGEFDFKLKFYLGDPTAGLNVGPRMQAQMSSASDQASANEPSASDGLFKALEKQLGLQLIKSAKGFALDTIVIDHIEEVPIQ